MQIVEEIRAAALGIEFRDHDVVPLKILYLIVEIGNHQSVFLAILRILCPNIGQVSSQWSWLDLIRIIEFWCYHFFVSVCESYEQKLLHLPSKQLLNQ